MIYFVYDISIESRKIKIYDEAVSRSRGIVSSGGVGCGGWVVIVRS